MPRANVDSIDALKDFRVALCRFGDTTRTALEEADAEVQRASAWLSQEQSEHWKREERRWAEKYQQAKSAYTRKKAEKTALGARRSCVDEEQEMKRAERMMTEARQKRENVKRWTRVLEKESFNYSAAAQGLALALDADMPRSLALLDRMLTALEAYAASPVFAASTASDLLNEAWTQSAGAAESMAREVDEQAALSDVTAAELRAAAPDDERRAAAARASTKEWPPADAAEQATELLDELETPRTPVEESQLVVLALGVEYCEDVFLLRSAPASDDDSGWFIGAADGAASDDVVAVTVGELTTTRSTWAAALDLPVGSLVRIERGRVAAVFDGDDRPLAPTTGGADA